MSFVSRYKQAAYVLSSTSLLTLAIGVQPLFAASYHQISVPNSTQNTVTGINNLNQIVGTYYDQKGNNHGFIISHGKYTTIDFGQGNETWTTGINDEGVMVGFYQTPPPDVGPPHGWIDQNGTFTQIDYPNAYGTFPQAINKSGEVVGYWFDGGQTYSAFKYVNGVFTALNLPNAVLSFANGVNTNGDISGSYWVSQNGGMAEYGFILHSNGKLDTINDPAPSSAGTLIAGINDKLQAVGSYNIANTSYFSGFGYANGKFLSLNYPNAISTTPADLNNNDIVVGTWYPTGPQQNIPHGFYYVP